ncbi:MAG: hypothetical protein ACE5PO_09250, partial [Candidatus Bathyarchaeia archaeon]
MTSPARILILSHKSEYLDRLRSCLESPRVLIDVAPPGGNIAVDSYRGVVISGGSLSKDAVEETLPWYRRVIDKVKVPV